MLEGTHARRRADPARPRRGTPTRDRPAPRQPACSRSTGTRREVMLVDGERVGLRPAGPGHRQHPHPAADPRAGPAATAGCTRACTRSAAWTTAAGSRRGSSPLAGRRRAGGRRRRRAARPAGRPGAGGARARDRGRRGRRAPARAARSAPGRRPSSPATCAGSGPRSTPAPAPSGSPTTGSQLDNGFTLPETDLVVLTAGGRPSTALARRAGLMVRRGVVVDAPARLASPTTAVHAIGDCAEHAVVTTGFVAARLGAGRGARPGAARRGRRRTTAAGASRGCAPPASTSPCSATPSAPRARSSR